MTVCQILVPGLFVLLLGLIQALLSDQAEESFGLGTRVPECVGPADCHSLVYGLIPHFQQIDEVVARESAKTQCFVAYAEGDGNEGPGQGSPGDEPSNLPNDFEYCVDGEFNSTIWDTWRALQDGQVQCDDYSNYCNFPVRYIRDATAAAEYEAQVVEIMNRLGEDSFGSELAAGDHVHYWNNMDYAEMRTRMIDNPNTTQAMVLFVGSTELGYEYLPSNFSGPYYAASDSQQRWPTKPLTFIVVTDADSSFGTHLGYTVEAAVRKAAYGSLPGVNTYTPTIEYSTMPSGAAFDAVQNLGGLTFGSALLFNGLYLMYRISVEKEQKLRAGMKMVGVLDAAYWLSWFIDALVSLLLAVLLIQLCGAIVGLRFFTDAAGGAVFLVMFTFGLTLIPISMCASMVLPSSRAALYIVLFVTSISAIAFIIFASFALDLVHTKSLAAMPDILAGLECFPPFNFQKGVLDIVRATPAEPTDPENPTAYLWSNVTESYTPCSADELDDDCAVFPPLSDTLMYQVYFFLVACVVALYTYFVTPSEGGRPLHFFAMPEFWKGVPYEEAVRRSKEDPVAKVHKLETTADADVVKAQEEAYSVDPKDEGATLLLRGLGKRYGFFNKSGTPAVKTMSLAVPTGQVLCVLGRNGSGKSTTLSCITGGIFPSWGDVFVCGHSVRYDLPQVQEQLGICPQDNVQWGELTAREHLEIFAEIKGVPKGSVKTEVEARLQEVDLLDVADKRVGAFSGGMKRRIQLVMAMMGSPKVVLIDECSAGVDPANRRRLWEAIQRFKKGRCVVLTTHQMDEAEVLGDTVCIMSAGTMQVLGSPLELKEKHGSGYRILMSARGGNAKVGDLQKRAMKYMPNATVDSQTGGQITFSLSPNHVTELVAVSKWLESHHNDKKFIVQDFAIEQASLQDVFFRVGEDL